MHFEEKTDTEQLLEQLFLEKDLELFFDLAVENASLEWVENLVKDKLGEER